jgi:hypothetical protein
MTPLELSCAERWVPELWGHVVPPGAALHREVGAGAGVTRGGLGAALSREVGVGATVTCGGPEAAMS